MTRTPDRQVGPSLEEEIQFDDRTADGDPTVTGALRRVGDQLMFKKSTGAVDITSGGGISETAHQTLRQAVHLYEEGGPWEGFTSGAYEETLPVGDPFPTSVIWWTSSAKTAKIIEETITYNGNKTLNTVEVKVYDTNGSTVLRTFTDTYAYSGVFVTSRTRTWS